MRPKHCRRKTRPRTLVPLFLIPTHLIDLEAESTVDELVDLILPSLQSIAKPSLGATAVGVDELSESTIELCISNDRTELWNPSASQGWVNFKKRGLSMSQDKPDDGRGKTALTAFISDSRDREGNTLYIAAICDNARNEILQELSDYDREELEKEVLQQFPQIEIENG